MSVRKIEPAPRVPSSLPRLPDEVGAGRLPDWRLDRLVHRACPVCGADAPAPVVRRPDGLEVSRCACGMIYLAELPDEEAIGEFYARYGAFKGYARLPRWRALVDSFRDVQVQILDDTGGLRGRTLVEVGASIGTFLERARWQGARCVGVDLDAGARAELARRGFEAHAALPPGRTFDIACAFQVLEHLSQPGELVAQLAAALPTDGRALLTVPNGDEAVLAGPTWVHYRVDLEHLNYFTLASLSRLLAAHGLIVEQFWQMSQPGLFRPQPPDGLLQRAENFLRRRLFDASRLARAGSCELGKKGWAAYKRLRIALLGARPSWRRVAAGFEMRIDPADWPDREMYLGVYEPALVRLVRRVMRPGDRGVDVGTHKGYFTLLMAQTVGARGRVWAADPDPRTFAAMSDNCERNRFDWVQRAQVAVADRRGTCAIQLSTQLGWTSRFPNELAKQASLSTIEVETRPLDELVDATDGDALSLIKIDAEGSEPLILRGMTRTVSRFQPLIYMEYTPDSLRAAGSSGRDLQTHLDAWRYRAFEVEWLRDRIGRASVHLRPVDLATDPARNMNLLCSTSSSPYHSRIAPLIG
jgi:FkbM family methyltransferase